MNDTDTREIILRGISASPGICIGGAYLVDNEGVHVVDKYLIDKGHLHEEVLRFKSAVGKAKYQLHELIENTPEELRQNAYILESHALIIQDKMLYGKTIETIEKEQVNAEWALKKVTSGLRAMFKKISDPYLKERADDIMHVSGYIMRNLTGAETEDIADIDKRVILVAHDLSPAETSKIQLKQIMAVITDRGGKASHTGIIAQSLEIPAVLGVGNATARIDNDDIVIVDGTAGIVVINPTARTLDEFELRKQRYKKHREDINRDSHALAETDDGYSFRVMANIELPENVLSVIYHGGDGIGLYRTEFQYLGRPDFPTEDELFEKYRDVVEVMSPKPVTIRTLDINGDKALTNGNGMDVVERNPALGLRAIRYCLKRPDIFMTQIRAILRASVYGSIRIMFPMISNYEEVRQAKQIVRDAAASLDKEGIDYSRNIEIGIMIEIPSAAIMADVLADEVDFFSIGTNDLIQYMLAIDRGNRQVAHLYHPLHPAVIRMVQHVANVAREKGVKVSMCGEMAGDTANLPVLLGLGIDELSMNPQAIPEVKHAIRCISMDYAKKFIKEVLKQKTCEDVYKLVRDNYSDIMAKAMDMDEFLEIRG